MRQRGYLCWVRFYLIIWLLTLSTLSKADHRGSSLLSIPDTLSKPRMIGVSVGQGLFWVGSMYSLNKAWYANYPKSSFHFYNDAKEWQQMDKIGHGWSAYFGAQLSTGLFRWAGVKPKRAAIYGAGTGIAFVTVIEILDGYSSEWGFSMADIAFNTGGALFFSSQEWLWGEQRIQYKFSAHSRKYSTPEEQARANNLFGKSWPEKILKDYNHQTYWLSINPQSFSKKKIFPKWLNLAFGYGADGMYGGYENYGIDKVTGQPYSFAQIKRVREFYFSPDIDLSKIEINGRKWKIGQALHFLKLKIPMPTVSLNSAGKWNFYPLYF